ncbi:MAG: adenylate/guanylate cyclase domain-containing protein [Gemmatimonadota bacterium]
MTDPVRRRLSCIMFTDMVGYSALAQADERRALELLEDQRRLLRPILTRHGGHEIKSIGDGLLVEFGSAVEAAECAVALQKEVGKRNADSPSDRRFQIRIGLHVGDIVFTADDVYGDGVNIASRVEGCAPPGGIAMTDATAQQVGNKLDHPIVRIGSRRLKNIREPITLYRIAVPWDAEAVAAERRSRRWWGRMRWQRIAISGVAAALVAVAAVWWATREPAPAAAASVRSLAVLPLDDVSPDPSGEYFADGMTEALIGGLSKIGSLRVISRTSAMHYRDTDKRLPEIARELGVDAVLEGSVVRARDRVRISVRLVHGPTERPLWSETYERNLVDVLALQDEIARAVATEVQIQLTPDETARLADAREVDPRAYEAYLRGRYWWNTRTRDGLDKALGYFRQAIEIDPTWAPGHAGMADVYQIYGNNAHWPPADAYPKARAAALRAIELDDNLAEAHATLSAEMRDYEWDWEGSEREIRRALELDPNYARGWQIYAWNLASVGRIEEGLQAMHKAREHDPLSPRINANVGTFLYFARDYESAERELKKSMGADSLESLRILAAIYVHQARFEEAIRAFDRQGTRVPAYLAHAYAVAGNRSQAQRIVNELEQLGGSEFVNPVAMATAYTGLGDFDRAFSWLERGYRERALFPANLQADPRLDPLRRDPRFGDLLRRMGLEAGGTRPEPAARPAR